MAEAEAWAMIPKLDKDKTGCVLEMHPIVLCKVCRHYGYKDMTNVDGFCYCLKRHEYPNPDWFCADGERKESWER